MARLPDPPVVSDPVRSDDEHRRLVRVSVTALAFVTAWTFAGLPPVTTLADPATGSRARAAEAARAG